MIYRKQTLSIELPNPVYSTQAILETIKKMITTTFASVYTNFKSNITSGQGGAGNMRSRISGFKMPNFRNFKFNKKNLILIGLPLAILVVVGLSVNYAFSPKQTIQGASDTNVDKPVASMSINREFNFPLRDDEGEEVATFKYIIESAELRKQIIVKGQRAASVEGRVFLVLNLKLVNDLEQGININTRDYVRIVVNGNDQELFAPDIHNDPVETQAISTKNTRLGIAINENDENITLKIGEINGEKQEIKINF